MAWALAAASAAFWGLRLFASTTPLPAHTRVAEPAAAARGDLTRLFGVDAPPPQAAAEAEPPPNARFQLIGVLSPRAANAAGEGLALIAVDGKPPRAFRVGAVVDGPHILKTVNARGATIGPRDGAPAVALNLAPVPSAATGVLPSAGAPQLPPPQPVSSAFVPSRSSAATQPSFPPGRAISRHSPPMPPPESNESQQPISVPSPQDQPMTR